MTRNGLTLLGVLAALVVLAADQASKWWILNVVDLPDIGQIVLLPVLNLTMVWNRGVTFGLLTGFGRWSYLLLAAVALAVVVGSGDLAAPRRVAPGGDRARCHRRRRDQQRRSTACASAPWWTSSTPISVTGRWYVFNLADAAIVCGVAALVIDGLLPPRAKRQLRSDDILANRPRSPAKRSGDAALDQTIATTPSRWPPAPRCWPAAAATSRPHPRLHPRSRPTNSP